MTAGAGAESACEPAGEMEAVSPGAGADKSARFGATGHGRVRPMRREAGAVARALAERLRSALAEKKTSASELARLAGAFADLCRFSTAAARRSGDGVRGGEWRHDPREAGEAGELRRRGRSSAKAERDGVAERMGRPGLRRRPGDGAAPFGRKPDGAAYTQGEFVETLRAVAREVYGAELGVTDGGAAGGGAVTESGDKAGCDGGAMR